MSFDVCDENGDGGLTWQEVEDCIVSFDILFSKIGMLRFVHFTLECLWSFH